MLDDNECRSIRQDGRGQMGGVRGLQDYRAHPGPPKESIGVDLSKRGVGIMTSSVKPVFRLTYLYNATPPRQARGSEKQKPFL